MEEKQGRKGLKGENNRDGEVLTRVKRQQSGKGRDGGGQSEDGESEKGGGRSE